MNLNATFIIQMLVFFALAWFFANFVVPPMRKALDERKQKIADGLAAAEQGKAAFAATNERIAQIEAQAKTDNASRMAEAEKQAAAIIEKAKADAEGERARILAQAKAEAEQEANRARDQLRNSVADLAVQGARQILQKEVDAAKHADLLAALKAKL